MKLLLIIASLAVGSLAVAKTVELMHTATAVMDRSLDGTRQ